LQAKKVDEERNMDLKPDAALLKYRLKSEANMSLKQVALRIGRDPSTVSMVINGRRKSAPIMKAIFEILDANREDAA
jgi:transcriptional regulator with XRE-family HTH domain